MKYLSGKTEEEYITLNELILKEEGSLVRISGAVHSIRDFGEFIFIVLRNRHGLIQCVLEDIEILKKHKVQENSCLEVSGITRKEDRAPNKIEVLIKYIRTLSIPAGTAPISINKHKLNLNLETELDLRPFTLRHMKQRAVFKIQEGIVRGFRDFLFSQQFTEIHTPKIVRAGAEGGSNIFKLDYFGEKAYLAQSPQFYKQTMAGVYDRVFEAAPVFRAEKHNTTRHLNEYTSLDFEMAYINDFTDIMEMETAMLKYIFGLLDVEYAKECMILGINIPKIEKIPMVKFTDIKLAVSEKYGRKIKDPYDLQPEEEILIGKYIKEETGSDFVFVTHYPSKKRPFYAMNDPDDEKYTLSFDLLMNGLEITTGGQRIHDYLEQVNKMIERGMGIEGFESYLMIHKNGMPPHGGLGLGLERLTMQICGMNNVRLATMFPRDQGRLEP